ncbi:MAG: ATP-binding protein [Nitrospiraceae bacterium]
MQPTFRLFSNLPIQRKLLLTSMIPVLAVVLLSLVTYRSVQTFSDDEEQLNSIYLVQRRAAEYMSLMGDLNAGFRAYVLTRQEAFLQPYRIAHDHILDVGDSIEQMVSDRKPQHDLIREVQLQVQRLMDEKDSLIKAVKAGRHVDALHYVEQGRGREIMTLIRQRMDQFNRLEQGHLNDTLAKIGHDRSMMITVILWGGVLALVLMVFALHLIGRSITGPLVNLAKAVRSSTGKTVPAVPVLERRDEIGDLTRVMNVMNAQIRDHIAQVEKSEAEMRFLNQDLAASESKYRSIVDHAPFGIFTAKGMALVFNNRYNRVLAGLDPDEDGDPEVIRQSIHPEDRERVLSEFSQAVQQNRPYETIFRFLHKDGTVRKVLSRRIPIKDPDGQTIRYQGFNIDITALDQMQARLSRAERLATLGQVAAGIAHEIRNPLVGVGSTISLLLEDTDRSDPRRSDLEVILNETRRLDRIVNQIIDYVRPRTLAPVVFTMEDLNQETLTLLSGALTSKRVKVERLTHPHLSSIEADRDQIKQVLLNVLQNAIEALGEQGTLHIATFDSLRDQESGMVLKVTDNGIGIAPGDLPHIFEPFFTTGKRRGTGLGLAICRNIIDAHRGEIQVNSQPGLGTAVRIWLPLRQQRQPAEF